MRYVKIISLLLLPLVLTLSCLASRRRIFHNDELYSYYLLSDPSFFHMWHGFNDAINNSPPLYFAIGWVWVALFGSGETSLRLFSSIAMSSALLVLWRVLRGPFGSLASLLGLALAFSAPLIVYHNANARPYGLFLVCTALCVAAVARNDRQPLSNWTFFINAASFALLVQSHLFGPVYSLALIAAQIITDVRRGRLRPSLYIAMAAGVATFALYLPFFFNQAENGNPRAWIPPAFPQDLRDFYASIAPGGLGLLGSGASAWLWIALVGAGSLVAAWWSSRQKRVEARRHHQHLLTVAWALLLVPVGVWFASWALKPLFVNRYMIPSVLGLAMLYAAGCSRFLKLISSADRRVRFRTMAAVASVTVLIGWTPLVWAQRFLSPNAPTPGSGDKQYGYDALPIVVPMSHDYLQRRHYSPNPDRYFFLLDWTTAVDPVSGDFAPQAYKELSALKRNYPSQFTTVLDQADFLASHPRFLVLKSPGVAHACRVPQRYAERWRNLYCWLVYDRRIASDPRFRTTRLGPIDGGKYELVLVERTSHGQQGAVNR